MKGIIVAAIKSGSGKTMFTCALLQALKDRNMFPKAFKCGPDYIDPMFHKQVIGVPSENLDSFFSTEEQLKRIYAQNTSHSQIAVIEGVMGLYDGLGGIKEEGSAYHLAKILKVPVILVIDAHGMGRSVIPLISGFLQYDTEHLIKGVVLNKISKSFYETIGKTIEEELNVEVLGWMPKKEELILESRHLGLKLPDEICNLKEQIKKTAEILEECVDVEKILRIMDDTKDPVSSLEEYYFVKNKVRIAVAKDEAFCFYYEENFRILEKYGAELIFFSPLHDEKLPSDIDGVILGGGYPELYAEQLEKNHSMRNSIKAALEDQMPSVAECGGFMYLHDELTDQRQRSYQMCHVVKGRCFYTGKLVRFGYIELSEKKKRWMEGQKIKAHEFHYYDSDANGEDMLAVKPLRKREWDCIYAGERNFWGFPHLYYASNEAFAKHFIDVAQDYRKER